MSGKVPLLVDTEWLAERLEDPHLRLLDATTFLKIPEEGGYYDVWSGKEAYEKGHIPGAVFADLLEDFSDPDSDYTFTLPAREEFVRKISELGVGEGTYVVVYDQGVGGVSHWASRLVWQLLFEGFDDVAVLEGGFTKWREEGRPVTTEPGSYPRGNFVGERREDLFVTKEDVKKAINDEDTVLINSLSEADFKGETDTYARSGRIPNSVHVFSAGHTNFETKELKEDGELRETFAEAGALNSDKKVITYCGSGIAATWNALLLKKLGQDNVAVYDGSMTEWAADKDLPLEKG
ncbi:sulfurtransferase [Oceanobacillus salinisoli]|uniref:sulfurtransferase n=1 Tax=Oceanobacillus salinisoli TaxID=2678611 RepID=UPI0012E2A461|nr:sulfurtransferase [Oceanobacillus salinisoli]